MSHIEIGKKPIIFDHDTYCEDFYTRCGQLYFEYGCCRLFLENDEFRTLDKGSEYFRKCDECKKVWKIENQKKVKELQGDR